MKYPFTVKIQEFNGGETGMPAMAVSAQPTDCDTPSTEKRPIAAVFIYCDDNPVEEVNHGNVYVMNENGKTIARYTLGEIPQ